MKTAEQRIEFVGAMREAMKEYGCSEVEITDYLTALIRVDLGKMRAEFGNDEEYLRHLCQENSEGKTQN